MTRIYRSSRDRVITGVCGGLSDATGMDSTWIRILVVISFFITAGTTFMIYVIAALVISRSRDLLSMEDLALTADPIINRTRAIMAVTIQDRSMGRELVTIRAAHTAIRTRFLVKMPATHPNLTQVRTTTWIP